MPRFLRFVLATSLLLLFVYLFYSPADVRLEESISTETHKPVESSNIDRTSTSETKSKANQRSSRSPDAQIPLKQQSDLRSKLSSEFPYDVSKVFPSFIWQTWKTTPNDGQFMFRAPEASWTAKHPGYIHEVITDDIAARLVHHLYSNIPEVLEAYDALPQAILKADFFRYLILLARGGVYSDIDTEALRPAWEWVPDSLFTEKYGLVIGIEADPDREDWAQWYSRRVQLCQWTMRAKSGHPALIEAVARLAETTLMKIKNGTIETDGTKNVIEWTGPAMWTDAVFAYLNSPQALASDPSIENTEHDSEPYSWRNLTGITEAKKIHDVIILPITGFSPGQGHMGSQDFTDPHAMVKHDFEGSWKPESERMKEEVSAT